MDEFPLHFYNACLCSPKSFSVHSQEGHPVFLVAWFSCSVPFSLSCCGLVCHRTVTAKCFRLCLSHVACSSVPRGSVVRIPLVAYCIWGLRRPSGSSLYLLFLCQNFLRCHSFPSLSKKSCVGCFWCLCHFWCWHLLINWFSLSLLLLGFFI